MCQNENTDSFLQGKQQLQQVLQLFIIPMLRQERTNSHIRGERNLMHQLPVYLMQPVNDEEAEEMFSGWFSEAKLFCLQCLCAHTGLDVTRYKQTKKKRNLGHLDI